MQERCQARRPIITYLFVLVAEMLQLAINQAWQNGMIQLPVEQSPNMTYPIIQYADDTLIIMPADPQQLHNLMDILKKFSDSTGLQVNYNKSSLVPINISTDRANELASILNCKRECTPFTYLGFPIGTTKPRVDDLMPMVSRLDKRLSGIASMMSYAGRLVHLKAVVAALPIFGGGRRVNSLGPRPEGYGWGVFGGGRRQSLD